MVSPGTPKSISCQHLKDSKIKLKVEIVFSLHLSPLSNIPSIILYIYRPLYLSSAISFVSLIYFPLYLSSSMYLSSHIVCLLLAVILLCHPTTTASSSRNLWSFYETMNINISLHMEIEFSQMANWHSSHCSSHTPSPLTPRRIPHFYQSSSTTTFWTNANIFWRFNFFVIIFIVYYFSYLRVIFLVDLKKFHIAYTFQYLSISISNHLHFNSSQYQLINFNSQFLLINFNSLFQLIANNKNTSIHIFQLWIFQLWIFQF